MLLLTIEAAQLLLLNIETTHISAFSFALLASAGAFAKGIIHKARETVMNILAQRKLPAWEMPLLQESLIAMRHTEPKRASTKKL